MIIDSALHPVLDDAELGPLIGSPWNRARLPPLLGQRATPPFSLLSESVADAGEPATVMRHMKARAIDLAVLVPLTRGLLPHSLHYRAIAQATNRWLHDRWLDWPGAAERFVGSVRVPVTDAQGSVTEIQRWASDPRFVQVAVPLRTPAPYGDERYFPIWEAAVAHQFPIYVLDDGPRTNIEPPPTPVGAPVYFAEYHALVPFANIVHIASLITSGVFERLPSLVFIFGDGGVDLARPMLWRVDKDWRAARVEIPWVSELPSAYVGRHLRFVSQPEDGRPDGRHINPEQLRVTEAADLVLFGSHYPFWDQVASSDFADWPHPARAKVLAGNALDVYPRLASTLRFRS